jgi:hypothetical protein
MPVKDCQLSAASQGRDCDEILAADCPARLDCDMLYIRGRPNMADKSSLRPTPQSGQIAKEAVVEMTVCVTALRANVPPS